MLRRLIQPARHGSRQPFRFMWLRRPSLSFKNRTGTSVVRSPRQTDLRTISDAYCQDCDSSSMRWSASRRDAAHAAVDVGEARRIQDVEDDVVTGVPKYRWSAGIDPGWM